MVGPNNNAPTLDPGVLEQIPGFEKVYAAGSAPIFTGVAREQRLQAGEILHGQDEPITHVWLLVEGALAEARRDAVGNGPARVTLARTAGPGVWLSIYDYLFEATAYHTHAVAQESCYLIAFEVSDLGRMIYQAPQMRQALADFTTISRLRTLPTLRDVALAGLGMLAEVATKIDLVTDEMLYGDGDPFDAIAFVDQGQVLVDKGSDGQPHWIGNGGAVGVPSAVSRQGQSGERTMDHTVLATMPTRLLKLPHPSFRQICGFAPDQRVQDEQKIREATVDKLAIFQKFDPEQRRHLTGYFSYNRYPIHHLLIQQSEEADSLWVLMSGSRAEVRALDKQGKKLMPAVAQGPTFFGETALLGQFPQKSTVEAVAGSEWMRLHWYDFEEFDIVEPDDLRNALSIPAPQEGAIYGKAARKRYKWLQPGETVVYFSRRHWVGFLRKNLPTIFIMLFLSVLAVGAALTPGTNLVAISIMVFLAFLGVLAFFWGFVDYRNDWLVVTNRRVYYQEKLLFINQWQKEAPLEQIQNVTFEQKLLGRLLNFGTLLIQTAGSFGDINFNYTTNFDTIDDVIRRQRAQRKESTAAASKLTINRQLEDRLGLLVEPPSRVYTGKLEGNTKTGWQERFAQRTGAGAVKESDDRIVWRQHWMALVGRIGWIFWVPFLIALMVGIFWYIRESRAPDDVVATTSVIEGFLALIIFIFILRLIWVIIDWRNDTYEVTNTEVSNMKQLPFGLRQQRRNAGLGRIQNVEMRIPSPIHLLFDFGTVTIQTAAEDGALVFSSVPDPRYVSSEISRRIERFQRSAEEEQAQRRMEDLPDWFEMYNRMDANNQTRQQVAFPPPPRPTTQN
ncbi:MAG: cyclic nucleotide-binding domain-containing protein [Caldilineaceae bacterium]|nr:cyclic nucleotide-binding domain-containing protein [Caldilineaceae bacterium]